VFARAFSSLMLGLLMHSRSALRLPGGMVLAALLIHLRMPDWTHQDVWRSK